MSFALLYFLLRFLLNALLTRSQSELTLRAEVLALGYQIEVLEPDRYVACVISLCGSSILMDDTAKVIVAFHPAVPTRGYRRGSRGRRCSRPW